mmetsp:Transcript_17636/g.51345  ORF Transcript_17636/g.51345 Transcript_17636/m.51345 type:complete len:160 (-) Transcript_17636:104-583(-)
MANGSITQGGSAESDANRRGGSPPAIIPPRAPSPWQLAMADKLNDVLGRKYKVVPAGGPNRYRLTGRELTVTGYATLYSFDVEVFPDSVDVKRTSSRPAAAAAGRRSFLSWPCSTIVAFCEVSPLVKGDDRLIGVQEILNDALEGGVIKWEQPAADLTA